MLELEPKIYEQYVATGDVKLIFWPVINHGNASLYATVTMECVGRQSPQLAWDVHQTLFENLRDLYQADRDYFVNIATSAGADQAAFETCYDDGSGVNRVIELDTIRRDRGIRGQPFFDINGTVIGGTSQLEELIAAAIADQ